MFSSRLPPSLAPNALMDRVQDLRAAGTPWLDLTETNPTAVGLDYPAHLLDGLANPAGACYEPAALGLWVAREAIAVDYARRARTVSPDRIVVTTSTSEAYSLLFKLLCSPGNPVLVPQPSYPLFDLLARLDGVPLRPYLAAADRRVGDRSRESARRSSRQTSAPCSSSAPTTRPGRCSGVRTATGSSSCAPSRTWPSSSTRSLPTIRSGRAPRRVCITGREPALTVALGGLSKSAGLPQVKLGWIAVGGPDAVADEALRRLDIICDTYLSVSTPVQLASPGLIALGAGVRAAIQQRVVRNLTALRGPRSDPAGRDAP